MVFSSNIFLFAFLPLTLFFYFLLPKKLTTKNVRNAILLIASLIFYTWGEMHYLWLLGFSIAANYFFGILIRKKSRNFFITIAVIFNLALLGYFKYSNFVIENLNQLFSLQITNKKISLLIGISFFTFRAISYLIDIYRRKCRPQKNIFDLAIAEKNFFHKPIFSANKNKNLPIIFTYKDSYFADLIPLVSEHFSQSFYINEFPCDLDFSILQKHHPNVVIQEFWEGRVEVVLSQCK